MGLYSGGLIIGRILASEIWAAHYFRKGFFFGGGEGVIIGILRYYMLFFFQEFTLYLPLGVLRAFVCKKCS